MTGVLRSLLAAWFTITPVMLAEGRREVVVAKDGTGQFSTLQDALNSFTGDTLLIVVKNGTYNEKVYIQRSNVTIVGEDRDSTRIIFAELRENWNAEHGGSDWGSGVVNIDSTASDITIANLTVYNNYGWKKGVFNKHQFAIRGDGTRIILLHCKVVSDGGDALSLWNRKRGMYYHRDCVFEGWVDYVCPRGWCYITGSEFFGHNLSASLWHDGSADKDQKFVIRNSRFDGVPNFPLGRHHRDGQFYLLDCRFTRNLANRPIYYPSESPNAVPWLWGDRQYYYNCHRDGGDYSWFKDNLHTAPGSPSPEDITARWTFGGKWDPEATMQRILPFASFPRPEHDGLTAPGDVQLGWLPGRNAESHNIYFGKSTPLQLVTNQTEALFDPGDLDPGTTYFWRIDEVTGEGIIPGELWSFQTQKAE